MQTALDILLILVDFVGSVSIAGCLYFLIVGFIDGE